MGVIKVILRKSYKKQNRESIVYLQLFLMKKKTIVNTGVTVDEENWDNTHRKVKGNKKNSKELNLLIEKARSRANDILVKYQLLEIDLSPTVFKSEFNNPAKHNDFISWMEVEINDRKGLITKSTIALHHSVKESIRQFKSNLSFSEIDAKFIEDFEKFLRVIKKNSIATVSKKLRTLKSYLNRAVKRNVIKKNPFQDHKIKKGKGRVEYLEEHELMLLIELYKREVVPVYMMKVLKYFLFACFTGLRITDVKRLKHDNIINDTIVLRPQKLRNITDELQKIPLCLSAKKLIVDAGKQKVKGRIFDTFCDPVTNRYLKKIAAYVGIEKNLHFHISRHTFATLFLEKTSDLATLQKLLGHANITQTMIYAHVSETKKKKQIMVFDNYI